MRYEVTYINQINLDRSTQVWSVFFMVIATAKSSPMANRDTLDFMSTRARRKDLLTHMSRSPNRTMTVTLVFLATFNFQIVGKIAVPKIISVVMFNATTTYCKYPCVEHCEGTKIHGLGSWHWKARAKVEKVPHMITITRQKLNREEVLWAILFRSMTTDTFENDMLRMPSSWAMYTSCS